MKSRKWPLGFEIWKQLNLIFKESHLLKVYEGVQETYVALWWGKLLKYLETGGGVKPASSSHFP